VRLQDRSIIVTGAGRGLGQAMALGALREGARVVAVDRDQQPLDALMETARDVDSAYRISALAIDLTQDGAADTIVAQALHRFGGVDGLVNCAGIGQETIREDFATHPVKFWEVGFDRWRTIFAVNADAVFRLCCAVLPGMMTRGTGRIVNVTTSLETMIRPGMSPYGPSKAAIEALSSIMAKDLAGTGITVNVLVPGGPARTRMMPGVPPERLIAPDVMVAPATYLLSDEAGGVTGMRIRADAWQSDLAPTLALAQAGAPAAWPGLSGGAARSPLPSV